MEFKNPYWSNATKMSLLQRWLIVHSIIYYELNYSVVEDRMFDMNSKQLVSLQTQFPEEAELTQYWYVFYDFDGSTGFHLYNRLNPVDAEYLYTQACNVRRLESVDVKRKKKSKKKPKN